MLKLVLVLLVFVLFALIDVSVFSQKNHCGLFSSFDAVCTKLNQTVFLLSARPCYSDHAVSFTILRTGSQSFFYHNKTENNIDNVKIQIGTNCYGIILDLHRHPHEEDYKSRLHVSVYWVKLFPNGTRADQKINNITDVYFTMETQTCAANKHGDNDTSTHMGVRSPSVDFKRQSYCDQSLRLGDFSTLCYKKDEVIYVTALDVCTSPYTTVVLVSEPHRDLEIVEKLTASRKEAIHVKAAKTLGGECGVQLEMHSHGSAQEKQHITLNRVCTNLPGINNGLIDDAYFTTYGMICQPATCSRLTPSSYECNRTLISPNEGREANAKVRLNFNICTSITLIADVTVQIEGFKNVYNGHLVGEHHFTIHDNDFRHNFTLGGPKVDPNKGYLPLDGGEISLFVKEDEKKNVFHVMLLRHYPLYHDAFPLMHQDFYLERKALCKRKSISHSSHASNAVKIVIPVLCVVVILILVVFAAWWWKKRKYGGTGLPYQIELGDDDNDDDLDDFNSRS